MTRPRRRRRVDRLADTLVRGGRCVVCGHVSGRDLDDYLRSAEAAGDHAPTCACPHSQWIEPAMDAELARLTAELRARGIEVPHV